MSADRPLSDFATEAEAADYADEHKACVYDEDMRCVFCRRWDH